MKRLIFPVTEQEDQLIQQASEKDYRSKCSFLRKCAVEKAREVIEQK